MPFLMSKFPISLKSRFAGSSVILSGTIVTAGAWPRPFCRYIVFLRSIFYSALGFSRSTGFMKKAIKFALAIVSEPTLVWSILIFSRASIAFLKITLMSVFLSRSCSSCSLDRTSFSVKTKTSYLPLVIAKSVSFILWSYILPSVFSLRKSVSTNLSSFSSIILR